MNVASEEGITTLKADLHIHSCLSPCAEDEMDPANIIEKLQTLGIKVFSITDHNSSLNCSAFEMASRDKELIFIPGIELQTSEEVHLLGYFPSVKEIDSFNTQIVEPALMQGMTNTPEAFGHQKKVNSNGRLLMEVPEMLSMPLTISLNETVSAIHDHGGLAVAAHLDRGFSVVAQLGFIPPDLPLDAVEIKEVAKVEKMKRELFKDGSPSILSSSDSHRLENMGAAKMRLKAEGSDIQSCLRCIKGEGGARVAIIDKTIHKTRSRPSPAASRGSVRDWKSLYK